MDKVDAHHHLWDLEHNPYPWLQAERGWRTYGDYEPMCRSYLVADFLADCRPHNVVRSVHVQANWDPRDPVGETRWVQSVADAHGFPHAIVGHADLASDDLEAVLAAHCEHANMRGIRHILGHTDDPSCTKRPDLLSSPAWARGYALLARFGLSFDLQAYPSQLARAAAVAQAHPEVALVVCHTGFPYDRSEAGIALWRAGMAALARLPHCHAKLSGPCMVMRDWTVERFGPFIHETIDLFGPDRCMFASNVPPDALAQSYDGIYDGFYAWAERYDERERRALFHDTATRFYRL
jgi:predicted TIM-barrel fold metal-dependent hydrolase